MIYIDHDLSDLPKARNSPNIPTDTRKVFDVISFFCVCCAVGVLRCVYVGGFRNDSFRNGSYRKILNEACTLTVSGMTVSDMAVPEIG